MQPQAGTDLEASLTSARKPNGEIILSSLCVFSICETHLGFFQAQFGP